MSVAASDTDALRTLNTDFIAAFGRGDAARLDQIFGEDFVSTNPDGSFIRRQQYLEMIPRLPKTSDLKGDDVEIRLFGDFAIVHCHISWRRDDGDEANGRFTDDYVKRDGEWKCVSAHVSIYQPKPAEEASLI